MASGFQTQLIAKSHAVKDFRCEHSSLADYLRRYARQTTSRGGARTFILPAADDPTIVLGYYTLTPAEMDADKLPPDLVKGLGRYPYPGFRLARLAVDERYAGKGVGRTLLIDAGLRCLAAADQVGGSAMFIDAKDEKAAAFYRKFGAQALADWPLLLVLPLATFAAARQA